MNRQLRQLRLCGVATCALVIIAVPGTSSSAEAGDLQACQSIEDNEARLACYDALLTPEPAPAADADPPRAAEPEPTVAEPAPVADTTPPESAEPAPAPDSVLPEPTVAAPAPAADTVPQAPGEKEPTAVEPAPAADTVATQVETAPADVPTADAEAQADTLTDDIGQESVKEIEKEKLAVRGRLARCDESRSGKHVFYFDNGQIWRQKDSKQISWKDCTVEVTISKDIFGYTMVRVGEKGKVRIERVR